MKTLEQEKWIEGNRRDIGKSKVWRLSSIGRKRLGIKKNPVPFNTTKIEHILGVGDIFQALFESGRLQYFLYEPKTEFFEGRRKVYAPDAFFYLAPPKEVTTEAGKLRGAFLLEYQRSPLSVNRWAAKWQIAEEFFGGGHFKTAAWQKGRVIVEPQIIVIGEQNKEQVQAGSPLKIIVEKTILGLV